MKTEDMPDEQTERAAYLDTLRVLILEIEASGVASVATIKGMLARLAGVDAGVYFSDEQLKAAIELLTLLKPAGGPIAKWIVQLREVLRGWDTNACIARLNAASRAIELYEAHENLATALSNFNAAMPKGAPKIAKASS